MTATPASPDRQELITALADKDVFRRRSALESLGRLQRDAAIESIVVSSLNDPAGYVVRTAAEIVKQWELAASAPRLRKLVSDPDPLTRRASLDALRAVGSEVDVDQLIGIISRDSSHDVRNAAAWALIAVTGPSTWRQSFEVLVTDIVPRHRQFACELVAKFGEGIDRELIRTLLADPDGHVRKAAERVLAGAPK